MSFIFCLTMVELKLLKNSSTKKGTKFSGNSLVRTLYNRTEW